MVVKKKERLTEFSDLIVQICEEKNITKKQLAPILGVGQSTLSRLEGDWETHWQVFKKIVLEVYPQALNPPLDAEKEEEPKR